MPFNETDSLVYEKKKIFIVKMRPNKIIKSNCQINGSSLEGRLDGTKFLTGYTYKAPILIKEDENIIFFPTSSIRLKDVAWISLNNLKTCYFDSTTNICNIIFYNNVIINSKVSYNKINNQILKATRYESILRKNKLIKA
jgi:competence protein ComK